MVQAIYPGADAKTLTQAVSTPIEQQMNGVDNMLYMYSVNANNGQATVYVDFDVKTNPDTDQVLSQLRVVAGAVAASRTGEHRRRDRAEVADFAAHADRPFIARRQVQRRFPHQLRHHQPAG